MIYSLTPFLQRTIWGGKKLAQYKKLQENYELPIGETWEVSTHPAGQSSIDGKPLDLPYDRLPYLVKFIDTDEALSVQVHPGDEYARLHEQSSGKTECWIVLEAQAGAGIYLGIKKGISKEEFQLALESKAAMNEYLNFYEVHSGEFYFVPPGSIHAIGAGITLAEIQQNSGVTYRVWDWNRIDKEGKARELHIQKSLDVINFDSYANRPDFFKHSQNLFQAGPQVQLAQHASFTATLYNMNANETLKINLSDYGRVQSLLNLGSTIKVNTVSVDSMSAILIEDEKAIVVESFAACSFILIE